MNYQIRHATKDFTAIINLTSFEELIEYLSHRQDKNYAQSWIEVLKQNRINYKRS